MRVDDPVLDLALAHTKRACGVHNAVCSVALELLYCEAPLLDFMASMEP